MTSKTPYPGLHPFELEQADIFFGRDEQTDQLVTKLDEHGFLAVVGPSGCGKSSLVRAGLMSSLYAGLTKAGARWRIALMRPGRRPMYRLTEALLGEKAMGPERAGGERAHGFLEAALKRGPLGLVEALRDTPLRPGINLLVVVDQFEELFRFRKETEAERNEADRFVALMVKSAEQEDFPIFVVITMRSDYIGDCGVFRGLPEHVSRSQFLTPLLTREEREEAITGPARVMGGDVDEALLNRLLNETSSDSDDLPVLQHLLMRMWNRARQERGHRGAPRGRSRLGDLQGEPPRAANKAVPVLTLADYEAVGGMKRALSDHANEAYDRLDDSQKRLAEIMFRRMCELGSDHKYTRRPTKVGEIAEVAGVPPEAIIEVADVFRGVETNFIVPGQPEKLAESTSLDISHESLIRRWDCLQQWASEEAESAKTYLRLSSDAALRRLNRAPLWRTPGLEVAQEWFKDERPNKDWARRYGGDFDLAMEFLEASEKAQDRERADKERQQRKELEQARKLAEAQEQRANTALAGEAKVVALLSQQALRDGENRTAIRMPLEMFARDPNVLKSLAGRSGSGDLVKALLAPENALFEALYRPVGVMLRHQAIVYSANFSDDGRLVVTATDDGDVRVWDAATGKPIDEPIRVTGQGRWASFDPEGRRIVVAYWAPSSPEGTAAAVWDRREKKFVARLIGHETFIVFAAFSRDGDKILTTAFDFTARLWNAADGRLLMKFEGHTQGVFSADFNRDGSRIVTASIDNTARVWEAETGKQIGKPLDHSGPVMSARFDVGGRHIVTASMDGTARVWDVKACEEAAETCEPLQTLRGHRKDVTSAMFSGDGQRVLTTANDKTVRIWDWRKGTTLVSLQGPSGSFGWVSRAFFDPAEERLLTTFGGAAAYIWDLKAYEATMAPVVLRGHTDAVKFAGFNVTGDRVVTASLDKTARVWDLSRSAQVHQLEHDDPVVSAAFDPTGRRIITAAGNAAHIWDQSTGKRIRSLIGHKSELCSAAFAPIGDRAVTASIDGTVRIWNGETGEELNRLEKSPASLTFATFAPDGRRVVTASTDGTARVWDVMTGKALSVLTAHTGTVMSAQFNADGGRIVTASVDKTVRVWDAASGDLLKTFQTEPEEALAAASFSPDGRYLVAAASDGSARIIDADSGATLATLHRHGAAVNWAAFDAGGRQMVTASTDDTARVWHVPTDFGSKITLAFGLLTPLTNEEQEPLGPACFDLQVSA